MCPIFKNSNRIPAAESVEHPNPFHKTLESGSSREKGERKPTFEVGMHPSKTSGPIHPYIALHIMRPFER